MSDDVLVACKLPHGIYLDVGKQRVKLNGVMQSGYLEAPFFTALAHAVGLTKVPRDFWEAWINDHKEFQPVKKGLIFAEKNEKRVLDKARERTKQTTGLERINPSKLPKSLAQVKAAQVE